jgi:hypothetical protein
MAATTLVKDVLWRAATLLSDVTPQYTRWAETDLVDFLNEGQSAIAKYLPPACSRLDAIKLATGTRQNLETVLAASCIQIDGTNPAAALKGNALLDIVRNMGADGLTPGRAVRSVSRSMLDAQSPMWHQSSDTAITGFSYDPQVPRVFYVTPGVKAGANVWAEIAWLAQPVPVTAGGAPGAEVYAHAGGSTVKIGVADEYADDLVNYIVARASMMPVEWADAAKAQAFATLFVQSINAKGTALTGTNPNLKVLPFAPEPIGRAKP